jgi:hypothetical protein
LSGNPVSGPTGSTDCTGLVITPTPSWCLAPFKNFLASGGIPNVIPAISTQQAARSATTGAMTDYVMPKVMEGSIGVQHEMWNGGTVEARYQYTRGVELPVQAHLNAETPFDHGFGGMPLFFSPSAVPSSMPSSSPNLAQFNALKVFNHPYSTITLNGQPDGFPGAITIFPAIASNKYSAVSFDYVQRSRWGVTGRASYTYSTNYDNGTNELNTSGIAQRRPQDINRLGDEWGRSALNIPQKFSAGFTYDLPKAGAQSGLLKGLLNDWQTGFTIIAQNGQSITPYAGTDSNGNGDSAGDRASFNTTGTTFAGSAAQRKPNLVCASAAGATSIVTSVAGCALGNAGIVGYVMGGGGVSDPNQRYVQTPAGVISNVRKGSLDSPGVQQWNMSLNKQLHFTERTYMLFRVDAYDLFNHRNLSFGQVGQTSNTVPSATYSNVATATFLNAKTLNGGSRVLQLGVRFVF